MFSLREENVKHFKVGENSYEAIAYSHRVHEKDENGVWQDIDFGMTYANTRGVATYQNKTTGVEFPAIYTKNQPLMSMSNDDAAITMTLVTSPLTSSKAVDEQTISTSTAKVTNPSSKFLTIEDAESANFSSKLLYENVLENTDLEYTVSYNSVKENIIVKKAAKEYIYYFNLKLDNLYPKLHDDGAVLFYHSKTNELEYVIPAPFMYDGKGNLSEAVNYTIEHAEENNYLLTITADTSWINEDGRSFPITIDPTVDQVKEIIDDTYVNSDEPDRNYGYSQYLCVRHNRIPLLKFTPLSLPDYAKLKEATLYMFYFYYDYVQTGYVNTSAHKFTAYDWAYDSITWQSIENLSNYGLDGTSLSTKKADASYGATANDPRRIGFDITSAVKSWTSGASPNYGIGLKYVADSVNLSVLFKSSESGYTHCPRITYQYAIRKFWLKNYFDFSLSDADIDNITEAIKFADDSFNKQFGIRIYNDGTPHINDVFTDVCEHGNDQQCTETCTDHYTDVVYISEQLYDLWATDWDHSKRIVYWTDRSPSAYCTHENGYCAPYNFSGNGVVVAHVYDHQPAIHFLNIIPDNGTNEQRLACMGLTLVHELAHTFGMDDVYNEDENEDKEPEIHHEDGFQCVMEKFGENDAAKAVIFYNAIRNNEAAFCDECAALLTDAILP